MADIRDWELFMRGRWKWTAYGYDKGFPRGCSFSDVDAITEFDGHTLYIEAKHWDGVGNVPAVDTGTLLLLKHVAEQPDVTVLLLWGCAPCNDPWAVRNMATDEFHDWRGLTKPERRRAFKAVIDRAQGLKS